MSESIFIFDSAMKRFLSLSFFVRLLSPVVFVVTTVVYLLCGGAIGPAVLTLNLWLAAAVLLLCPSNSEPLSSALPFIIGLVAGSVVLEIVGASPGGTVVFVSALLLGFAFRRSVFRYSDITLLFHVTGVWTGVVDYMYLLHLGMCLCAGMLIMLVSGVWGWCLLVLVAGLYAAEFYRVVTRRTVFLSRAKEAEIRSCQKGSAFKDPVSYVDSDSKSACLYNEVVRIMEKRRPWLQDDFGIDDLARMSRTNRMYLSKTINFHSGRNFNQLVNYYRVKYSLELIHKDPKLKIVEIAQMSGFHTVVSFNSAFKLNQRMTPSEYIQSLKKLN